jgi:hypothetical protein
MRSMTVAWRWNCQGKQWSYTDWKSEPAVFSPSPAESNVTPAIVSEDVDCSLKITFRLLP